MIGLVTVAVAAQVASGYSSSSTLHYAEEEEMWREAASFADCMAGRQTEASFALLRTDNGSVAETQQLRALARRSSCLVQIDNMRVPTSMIRGAVAEALYKRHAPLPADLRWPRVSGVEARTISDVARCYVSAHSETARGLVEGTGPGSRSEADAMSGIMADFRACLPSDIRNRPFNLTQVRFRLAETLLRIAPPTAQ